jgi:hypothetical protein
MVGHERADGCMAAGAYFCHLTADIRQVRWRFDELRSMMLTLA